MSMKSKERRDVQSESQKKMYPLAVSVFSLRVLVISSSLKGNSDMERVGRSANVLVGVRGLVYLFDLVVFSFSIFLCRVRRDFGSFVAGCFESHQHQILLFLCSV